MKKLIVSIVLSLSLLFALSAEAKEDYYSFDSAASLSTVTASLASGGSAKYSENGFSGGALELDGSYGVLLGDVSDAFSVAAMVKLSSTGGTDTIFFKNMGTLSEEKWTGVRSDKGSVLVWTNGGGYSWTEVTVSNSAIVGTWAYVIYTEKGGVGTLYLNGEKIGSGNVAKGAGQLYLGATYWSGDAPKGLADELRFYDTALSDDEAAELYQAYGEGLLELPAEAIGDITLPAKLGAKSLTWESSDESVITSAGKVTRQDEDKKVTLRAYAGEELVAEFEITVLKKAEEVNKDVILSYLFTENDKDVIHDASGNGNHGQVFNSLSIAEDGAHFDGVDDYVKLPDGVLSEKENITIIFKAKPSGAQTNAFAYVFGNGSNTGYLFLNTARPTTNELRIAITPESYGSETAAASVPGVRKDEWGTVVVTAEGKHFSLYLDGELVMEKDLGMSVSELGYTSENYIAKSLYANDPYFGGAVSEFTVLNGVLSKDEIKKRYASLPEYLTEEKEEYIKGLSFGDGKIRAEIDDYGRDDVYIVCAKVDENGNVADFSIAKSAEELDVFDGDIIVFAFNDKDNVPGNIYHRGGNDAIDYAYTPGRLEIVNKKDDFSGGVAIIASYDAAGTLTNVLLKETDVALGEKVEIEADFKNASSFRFFYWQDMESIKPVK